MKRRERFHISKWAGLYVLSLFAASYFLIPTLHRGSDGDNAMMYYSNGLTPWSVLWRDVFIPKSPKPFLFDQGRPFAWVQLKLLWELGLSTTGYGVLNWVLMWASILAFCLGLCRLLSFGLFLTPDAPWMMACIIWWSAPVMILHTSAFYCFQLVLLLGIHFYLVSKLIEKRHRTIRIALVLLLTLFLFQTDESGWICMLWLSGWLAILEYTGTLKKGLPRFYWPLALIAAHMAIFRSFTLGQNGYFKPWEVSSSLATLWTNGLYFALAIFNGIVEPLATHLKSTLVSMDITPYPSLLPLILTITAVAVSLFSKKDAIDLNPAPKKKKKAIFRLGAAWLMLNVLGETVPFFVLRDHRLIYYVDVSILFLAAWVVVRSSQCKRPFSIHAPVALMVVGNALMSVHMIQNWNFMDLNIGYAEPWLQAVLARPELKGCTTEAPCCLDLPHRDWARHEWGLNWDIGAPKYPAFYPKDWPGAKCVRTVHVDI